MSTTNWCHITRILKGHIIQVVLFLFLLVLSASNNIHPSFAFSCSLFSFLFFYIVGYHVVAFAPMSSDRAMVEEVAKKVHMYVNKLLRSAQECEDEGVIRML